MDVGIPCSELLERPDEERARRKEAGRSFREAIEVVRTEPRRSWIVEVVAPGELGEQAPEEAEVVGRLHLDVAVPDRLAAADLFMDEPKRIGPQLHACVQEQHEIALRRRQAGPPRLEATDAGKTEHAQRHRARHRCSCYVSAAVGRAVVHEDEIDHELGPVRCRHEGSERRREV